MGIGFRELLIILLIALLIFGAKKLRSIGSDLGAAVRDFKKSVNDGEKEQDEQIAGVKQLPGGDADFTKAEKQGTAAGQKPHA